ncbi:HNH endonuclease [Vibrio fluvialis]|nr:HNH endonuclease [Vibrio fluvialis]MBY7939384.1 HNH endonuclease [Vibrio fluvialis]
MKLDKAKRIANLSSVAKPLTQEDILDAIAIFEAQNGDVESYSFSTEYDLLVDKKHYPPKAIFGLALSALTGENIKSHHFTGGVGSPCFKTLERLGFTIVPKSEIREAPTKNTDNEVWTEAELKDSVREYLRMRAMETAGEKCNKAQIYRNLSDKYLRGAKAYEFRMQNISYVFELLGRRWVTGLKPKRNITAKQVEIVERFIAELENKPFEGLATFEAEVKDSVKSKQQEKPTGSKKPKTSTTTTTTYARDPKVKAWVLKRANGVCECCSEDAPFKSSSGEPFLEVHHLIRLMDNGPDTVENCAGICPNCHRRLHYGEDRDKLTSELLAKIAKEA